MLHRALAWLSELLGRGSREASQLCTCVFHGWCTAHCKLVITKRAIITLFYWLLMVFFQLKLCYITAIDTLTLHFHPASIVSVSHSIQLKPSNRSFPVLVWSPIVYSQVRVHLCSTLTNRLWALWPIFTYYPNHSPKTFYFYIIKMMEGWCSRILI